MIRSAEEKFHSYLKYLRKFLGIVAWMLELIMALPAVIGKFSPLTVVGAVLMVNAALSFSQEYRGNSYLRIPGGGVQRIRSGNPAIWRGLPQRVDLAQ